MLQNIFGKVFKQRAKRTILLEKEMKLKLLAA